jgi:hypothetical protein
MNGAYVGNDWQSCVQVEKVRVDGVVNEPFLLPFADQLQGPSSELRYIIFSLYPSGYSCPYFRQLRFIVPLCRMSRAHRYPVPQCMECPLFRFGPNAPVASVSPM